MLHDLFGGHAFANQLFSHRVGISHDSMRQPKCAALQTLLRRSAKAIRLAFVCRARTRAIAAAVIPKMFV